MGKHRIVVLVRWTLDSSFVIEAVRAERSTYTPQSKRPTISRSSFPLATKTNRADAPLASDE